MLVLSIDYEEGTKLCSMFVMSNQVDVNTYTLAKYLMELTIVEYDLAHINPSEIAAAALCLAMKLLRDTPDWVRSVHSQNFS